MRSHTSVKGVTNSRMSIAVDLILLATTMLVAGSLGHYLASPREYERLWGTRQFGPLYWSRETFLVISVAEVTLVSVAWVLPYFSARLAAHRTGLRASVIALLMVQWMVLQLL